MDVHWVSAGARGSSNLISWYRPTIGILLISASDGYWVRQVDGFRSRRLRGVSLLPLSTSDKPLSALHRLSRCGKP